MTETNMNDVKAPETISIPLKGDRVARFGGITLNVMCWAEEKFGSWEAFAAEHLSGKATSVVVQSEFMFQMLENKSEFKDLDDFRNSFDLGSMNRLTTMMTTQTEKSMPKAKGKKGDDGKK
jgi:hypothetical protein